MAGERQRNAVLDSMAEGDWAYSNVLSGAVQWTAGTERAVGALYGSADHKTILVYVRYRFQPYDLNGSTQPYQWFLIKTIGNAVPQVADTGVFELLMNEKRIFARGCNLGVPAGGSMPPTVKLSKFSVELEAGEYLQLVIIPMATPAGATMVEWVEQEAREVALTN